MFIKLLHKNISVHLGFEWLFVALLSNVTAAEVQSFKDEVEIELKMRIVKGELQQLENNFKQKISDNIPDEILRVLRRNIRMLKKELQSLESLVNENN